MLFALEINSMIFINVDTVRPIENVLGLVFILEQAGAEFKLFTNSKKVSRMELSHPVLLKSYSVFKRPRIEISYIVQNRIIVFGGGLVATKYKILNFILNNYYFQSIFLPPGIIDKPIGKAKYRNQFIKNLFYVFRAYFIVTTKRTYILSDNKEFYSYYKKWNFLPNCRCRLIVLPKHLWMKKVASEKSKMNEKFILYAPTHDAGPSRNVILDGMVSLPEKFCNYRISVHPQDRKKYDVPSLMQFDGAWSDVGCVITDCSSLGLDFSYACNGKHFRLRDPIKHRGLATITVFGLQIELIDDVRSVPDFDEIPKSSGLLKAYQSWLRFLDKLD